MNIDALFLNAQSIFTAVSLLTFLGIMAWAYSSRQKAAFNEAANLPFADDELDKNTQYRENQHG